MTGKITQIRIQGNLVGLSGLKEAFQEMAASARDPLSVFCLISSPRVMFRVNFNPLRVGVASQHAGYSQLA